MRGRKPNPKKVTADTATRQPPVAIPRCPANLIGEARREWDRLTKLQFDAGLIAHLDRSTLAIHCSAWARWVDADAKVTEQGSVVKQDGQVVENPYLRVADRAAKQMRELLSEFGLSPAARHRLLGAPKKQEQQSASGWEGRLAGVVG